MLAAVREVAATLARLHSHLGEDLVDQSDLPKRRASRAAPWLSRIVPEAATLFAARLHHGEEASARGETVLVHGDLKPEHLLVDGGASTLIDLDSSGSGRASSDLAALVVRLEDSAAAALLLDEYQSRAGPLDEWTWSRDWALASLKFALYHAQHQTQGWRDAVVRIAEADPPPLS
ncbi:MAG TPA: hypothetical protein ENH15_01810 [Actinobacteria bacterium]|nr:hypothetical protein [Actinomycetota bacterium]